MILTCTRCAQSIPRLQTSDILCDEPELSSMVSRQRLQRADVVRFAKKTSTCDEVVDDYANSSLIINNGAVRRSGKRVM